VNLIRVIILPLMESRHPPSLYIPVNNIEASRIFIVQQGTARCWTCFCFIIILGFFTKKKRINYFVFNFFLIPKEPSSNVAPRTSGRKIEGSLIAIAAMQRQAYLTCDATAFPVPVYRYFPVFSTGVEIPTTFSCDSD
jgi:hypothetical protein